MPIIHFARIPLVSILLAAVCVFPASSQTRGMHVEDEQAVAPLSIGRQYCLLIGASRYREWLPLENPVRDAKALRQVLVNRYRMDECIELYDEDATKENIVSTFSGLNVRLAANDSILIYYAGHGHYDEKTDTGYWIPYDGGTDRALRQNWISNREISGFIGALASSHVFLISDSCFSGGILNLVRGLGELDAFKEAAEYFNKAYARVSRQVITSGAFEDVPDKSSFSRALVSTLRSNTRLLVDPYMLFSEIRLSVRETTPLIGNLKVAGHQDGASFLLFLKEGVAVPQEAEPKWKIPLVIGAGEGMMFPMGDVGSIMDFGNAFDGFIGIEARSSLAMFMAGISFGTFYSPTSAISEYEYNILAFSCGGVGRAGFTLGILDAFVEFAAGAMIGNVDYRENYVGITDLTFVKPYVRPALGVNVHMPFSLDLTVSCGYLALFCDNNPYLAIVPAIRIEYEM